MASSLREQLLKAGLVSEKQARQAKHARHQEQKVRRQTGPAAPPAERTEAQRAREAGAERSRALNRAQQDAAARKALEAQIRQIIAANRLPRDDGDVGFNFVHKQRIRRLFVTPETHARLVNGTYAIVTLQGRYDIVPRAVAEKIRERDPSRIVVCNDNTAQPAESVDDEYAQYRVPDDLMW